MEPKPLFGSLPNRRLDRIRRLDCEYLGQFTRASGCRDPERSTDRHNMASAFTRGEDRQDRSPRESRRP